MNLNTTLLLIGLAAVFLTQPAAVAGQRRRVAPSPYVGAFTDTAHAANERVGRFFAIQRCAQSPGRRNGFCLATSALDGDVNEALRPLRASAEPESAANDWQHSANSGCALSGWVSTHRTGRSYVIPSQALARNGTRLHRIWVERGEACFDLSVPW